MKSLWIVYDRSYQETEVVDSYKKALEIYEAYKDDNREYVSNEGEFTGDESVMIAKVERHFHGCETGEKAVDYDENGEEFETDDNLWDWKEDIYKAD